MAPLRNQRHELFVQHLVRNAKNGMNVTQAYIAAGYAGRGHAAEVGGSRLMRNAEVRKRIDALTAPAARRAKVTAESLLDELQTTISDAREAKQHNVVVGSLTLAAKLAGLLRERIEVSHAGPYGDCESLDDCIDRLLETTTPGEALADLAEIIAAIEARAAVEAIVIEEPPVRPWYTHADRTQRHIEYQRQGGARHARWLRDDTTADDETGDASDPTA
jgi:hypothetical protein